MTGRADLPPMAPVVSRHLGTVGGDRNLELDCGAAPATWYWDEVLFERLVDRFPGADTGHACLLSVRAGGGRAILPAWIDAGAEHRLASLHDLRADVERECSRKFWQA